MGLGYPRCGGRVMCPCCQTGPGLGGGTPAAAGNGHEQGNIVLTSGGPAPAGDGFAFRSAVVVIIIWVVVGVVIVAEVFVLVAEVVAEPLEGFG